MAIDTADKRFSMMGLSGPPVYPAPDGTIDAADRLQWLGLYRGLAEEAPPAPSPSGLEPLAGELFVRQLDIELEPTAAELFNLIVDEEELNMQDVTYHPYGGVDRTVRAQFDPLGAGVVEENNLLGVTEDGVLWVSYDPTLGIDDPDTRDQFTIEGDKYDVTTVGPKHGGCRRIGLHRIEVGLRSPGQVRVRTL